MMEIEKRNNDHNILRMQEFHHDTSTLTEWHYGKLCYFLSKRVPGRIYKTYASIEQTYSPTNVRCCKSTIRQ